MARQHSPFSVRATGLGVFAGAQPVLYVPVVRSVELSRFHEAVWKAIGAAAAGAMTYYEPQQWIPHITLACGDLEPKTLGKVTALLGEREILWDIEVDNVALVYAGGGQSLFRYELGGEMSG
jgi:2'-5' RNA ligase